MKSIRKLIQRPLLATAALALLGIFVLYTRPDFLLTLANQVWACF